MRKAVASIKKETAFTDSMFRRLFRPTLFSALGLALGDIADALFVGIRIGGVGLATMSIVAPVYMVYNVLDIGIAVGASIHYIQATVKGKAKKGVEIFSQMFMFALAVSLLIAAVGSAAMPLILRVLGAGEPDGQLWIYTKQYLQIMFLGAPLTFLYFLLYYCVRCDDAEKLASAGYLIGYITDIAASAVFVLGFKMDVRGAILATVLGKAVGICIFSFHFTRKWAILRFRPVKPDIKLIFGVLKTGMSSSMGYVGQFAALLVVNNVLLRIGGENALAEFNIVQNVSYVAFAVFTALADTVRPLSGTFFTEHNYNAVRRVMSLGVWICVVSGAVVTLLCGIFASSICTVFGLTGEALSGGTFAVRIFCLSVIPAGINKLYSAAFQATKREKLVFLISQLRTFVCFLASALVLSAFGLKWFWFSFLSAELITIAVWLPVSRSRKQMASEKVFGYLLDTNSSNLADLLEKAEAFCEANEASPQQVYCVTICVEEVCQAIIENAFRKNGDEYIQITLCFEQNGTALIHMRDNAVSFDPFSMKTGRNYDEDEHLASLGIQIVKAKAKRFFYRRYSGFNTLTVEVE